MATHPLISLKRHYGSTLLRILGVVGVGVGPEDLDDERSRLSLVLYVESASVIARLREMPRIRALFRELSRRGWTLKTVIAGAFSGTSAEGDPEDPGAPFKRRIRPVQAGYSVGTAGTGTAGLLVRDADGRQRLLSNAHVLNGGNDDGEYAVLQPGPADACEGSREVGSLLRSVKLRRGHGNYLDAALASLSEEASETYPGVGELRGYCSRYGPRLRAVRAGRTTGLVRGRVQSIDTDVIVEYALGEGGGRRRRLFQCQTVFEQAPGGSGLLQDSGDSGGVWVVEGEGLAAALSFAASANGALSVASPFAWVAQVLDVTVQPDGAVDMAPEILPEGEEMLLVEELGEETVASLKGLVMEAGTPWVAPEADDEGGFLAQVGHLDVNWATLKLGEGTQLSGGSDWGVASYTLETLFPSGSWRVFARVVAVRLPPPPGNTYAAQFPEQGEYWFYDGGNADLTNTNSKLRIQCTYWNKTWSDQETLDFCAAALAMSRRMTPALLALADTSWYNLGSNAVNVAASWYGSLMYTVAGGQQINMNFGLYMSVIQSHMDTATIICPVWYRTAGSDNVVSPLFTAAPNGTTSGTLDYRTDLPAPPTNNTWRRWPPMNS